MKHIDEIVERLCTFSLTAKVGDIEISAPCVLLTDEGLRAILQEAIEPYRKDAERMDFVTLHGQHFEIYKLAGKFAVRYKSPFPDKAGYGWFDSPREAIDAAIAAAKING